MDVIDTLVVSDLKFLEVRVVELKVLQALKVMTKKMKNMIRRTFLTSTPFF